MLPAAKLGELVRLAELCVDLLQENNDYYAEVSRERRAAAALLCIHCSLPVSVLVVAVVPALSRDRLSRLSVSLMQISSLSTAATSHILVTVCRVRSRFRLTLRVDCVVL